MPLGRVAVVESPGVPAAWVFVVGHRFLAAVPFGTARVVVDLLTERVFDDVIDLESIMAILPMTGPDAVSSFLVLVRRDATDTDGVPVSAVVRGAAVADVFSVGGSRRFSDRAIRPWLLADFRAVTGLVIGSVDAPVLAAGGLGAGRSVGTGAYAGNSLFWSILAGTENAPVPGSTTSPEHAPAPEYARPPAYSALPEFDTVIRPPRPLADGDTVLRAPTHRDLADHDTVIRPPRLARHDAATGDTALRARPEPNPGTAPNPGTSPGTTPTTGLLAVPRPPALDSRADDAGRHAFQLAPGEPHRLTRAYVLGRNPSLPRIVIGEPPRLLTVPSATSAVSSTHVEIRQEGDSIVVTDLGSTNGTVVRPPRGRSRRLRSGQSLAVTPGTLVDIGDGNIVEILR